MPGQPEPRGDLALVHHAGAGQARVLLVQREHAAAQPLVLERLAQDRGAVHRLAVVGEAERAGVGELRHLGQRLALQPARDRGEEADRDARLAPRRLAQRAQDGGVVDDRVGVRHRDDGDEAAGGGRAGARVEVLLVLLARARAGARAGRRSRGTGAGPRPRAPRRPRARRALPGAPSSAITPARTSTSCAGVDALARVEHVRAADEQVGGRLLAVHERLGARAGRRRGSRRSCRHQRSRSGAVRPASSS